MEIPSSSPVYTPLHSKTREIDNEELPQVQLFHHNDSETDIESDEPSPHASSKAIPDTFIASEPLELAASQSDNETTIFSDDDYDLNDMNNDVTMSPTETMSPTQDSTYDPQKTTQNYFEELLTESLLDSLPLPPNRKNDLRGLRNKQQVR